MKKYMLILVGLFFLLSRSYSQSISYKVTFEEDPGTHNMHICYDGQYYYTVNGGKSDMGKISKLMTDGSLVKSYEIKLDMRSIMYNKQNKKFYVNCYDRNIYEITDLSSGTYKLISSELYDDEQAALALSPDGKQLYYYSNQVVKVYSFPACKVIKEFRDLVQAVDAISGGSVIAVDNFYFYLFDGEKKMIYAFNRKTGEKVNEVEIYCGNYGFSLSAANDMIFVATDGNYSTGNWYGYKLW